MPMYTLSPKRLYSIILLLLCVMLFVTSCGSSTTISTNDAFTSSSSSSSTQSCEGSGCNAGTGSRNVRIFTQPEAGVQIITDAIKKAKKSVWLQMYLLTDTKVINALQEAAHEEIDVRVMLEMRPYGEGNVSPRETMDRLRSAGVQVKPTSPSFSLTHSKLMLIDQQQAYVMTSNFTRSALGGSKNATNREFGVIDSNIEDVQGLIAIFKADWNRSSVSVTNPNLVVSPINSRSVFKQLITSARTSLAIEAESMKDNAIEQAIIQAAARGVRVQVILPRLRDASDTNRSGMYDLKRGGVQVRTHNTLVMHAKVILVDERLAFVGSVNISTPSFDRNREIGVLLSGPSALATLQETIQEDWQNSTRI